MKSKVTYRAAGLEVFKITMWPVIAIGYTQDYFDYDDHHSQKIKCWYLPFIKIISTQYHRKFIQ